MYNKAIDKIIKKYKLTIKKQQVTAVKLGP